MSEIICIAKPNDKTETEYPGYKKFYEKFSAQLKEFHEVHSLDLPDIWVRDFLPVQNVCTGQLYQPFFNPRYANYTPQFTKEIRQTVLHYFPHAQPCNVRIDGGNIVLSPDKKYAFCMEKQTIFKKSEPEQKAYADKELKKALGVEEILWLPHQNGDKIGHIDGYIQFLGDYLMEGSVELYGGITTGTLLDDKATDVLYRYINNIVPDTDKRVHLICKLQEDSWNWLDASGLYVNFLETSKAVFVPQFGLPEDERAFNTIKRCTYKTVIKVDCSQIAQYGGAVHCLTKEYK